MKSAYELAMERLEKDAPSQSAVTEELRAQLAEIADRFKAKIAEREVFLGGLLSKASANGSVTEVAELEEQLAREVRRLKEQCESAKEKARAAGTS